jgi:hypothetical protein
MSWAQRLKRVFKLDLESCEGCGGQARVIACIEDPLVIAKILSHREQQPPSVSTVPPLPARGPARLGVLASSARRHLAKPDCVAFAGKRAPGFFQSPPTRRSRLSPPPPRRRASISPR